MNELSAIPSLPPVVALFPEEIPLFQSHLPALTACDKSLVIMTRSKKGCHQKIMKAIVIRIRFQ